MRKLSLLCYAAILILLPVTDIFARNHTPMETFIRQVKETNTFVTVSNIWQPDNNFDQTPMLQKVEKGQPLTIDYTQIAALLQKKNMAINLVVPGISAGTYTLSLARYDFFSTDFEVHTWNGNTDKAYNYTPGLYYRGVVDGIPGSVAAFSFFNNEVYGIFSIPGEGNYTLVPNIMVGKYYDYNQHYILYNDNDLKIKDHAPKCATDELPDVITGNAQRTTTTLNNDVYNNCTEVRVFEVGDYALYKTKGSSVTNVTNYLTALFNNQSTLYRNEGIPIVMKYIQVDTIADPWNSIPVANSSLFLDKFGYITQNTLHGCDLAILVSTCLNGGYGALGGVAWLQSMCTPYRMARGDTSGPYAFCDMDNSGVTNFPTYSWDVEVITHEMGHVVGSPHTHRCCWNPPGTGTTAIDGCYALEGTCAIPVPALPVGGGTIMSYCHLTGDGINFSNGFGPQPGDTIRYYVAHHFSSSCGVAYNLSTALSNTNRVKVANRECTDMTSGLTYYWNDNNTADQTDDTLVLMINKNGNSIGTLDSVGFSVTSSTLVRQGSGRGDTIIFPSGLPVSHTKNISMRRYWNITSAITPASAVDVYFPFLQADTTDVDGSVPGEAAISGYQMYKVNSPVNPNPTTDSFKYATAADISLYTYGATASTTNWALTTVGSTYFADMKMTKLAGGGSGFYSFGSTVSVNTINIADDNIYVYPNPANNLVNIETNGTNVSAIKITDVLGRGVLPSTPANTPVITIALNDIAAGLYFIQLQTELGTITKKIVVVK